MEFAYVGSFTTKERGGLERGGISVFFRGEDGLQWQLLQEVERMNPSFLAFDAQKEYLYTAQGDGCTLASFKVDKRSGTLSLLNEKHIGLYNSVSLAVDPTGKFLAVACLNHGSGAILSLRLNGDGSIGEICDIEVPQGTHGPLQSQPATQPHQVVFDPEGKYLIVCDKGLDVIHSYVLDLESGCIFWKHSSPFPTSTCPRHVVFHPFEPYAYLLAEWIGGIFPCRYDDGIFTPMEWHKTAPLDYVGHRNIGAEIAVHPSGKFLYASNRGYSSVVCFEILKDGKLAPVEWITEHVAKPRFFTVSEDGTMLYCANEETHCISIYSINCENGRLTYLGNTMYASAPACILFANAGIDSVLP